MIMIFLFKNKKYSPAGIAVLALILLSISGCGSRHAGYSEVQQAELEKKNIQLAVQYLQAGQSLKAITRLEKVLNMNPYSFEAYGMLAVVYQRQGEYAIAERNFKKALRIEPDNSDIRNNYGVLLYVTKKYTEAAKQFQRVATDVYYGYRDQVVKNLGATYLKMGDRDKAIQYYQHALRLNNNLPAVNLKLSEILFQDNQEKKAYNYYVAFAETGQQSAASLWTGICLARKLGKKKKMALYGRELARLYPKSLEYGKYQTLLNHEAKSQS